MTETTNNNTGTTVGGKKPHAQSGEKPNGHWAHNSAFPPTAEGLPKVALSKWKLDAPTVAIIQDGADADEQATALPRLFITLQARGMTKRQIAAVVWNRDNGISAAARADDRGYEWLCLLIEQTLEDKKKHAEDFNTEFFRRYKFVETERGYWDEDERRIIEHITFNDRFLSVFGAGTGPNARNAHVHWQLNHERCKGVRVFTTTYYPGKPGVFKYKGHDVLNRWRAPMVECSDVEPTLWLDLAERLIPDESTRNHLFDYLAFTAQNRGIKPGHHILFGGPHHGCGKDTLLTGWVYSIGGGIPTGADSYPEDRVNVEQIAMSRLDGEFTDYLMNELIIVQELQETRVHERRELGNKLKPFLASPPEDVSINNKFEHRFNIPNLQIWAFFTNHADAIALDRGERRWFAIWTTAPAMTSDEATKFWAWYKSGGVQAVAGWLMRRDVSHFHPKARAPVTAWLQTLVAAGLSDMDSAFHHVIGSREAPFDRDLVSPQNASEHLNLTFDNRFKDSRSTDTPPLPCRVHAGKVSKALTDEGWVSLGEVEAKPKADARNGKRVRVTLFAAPAVAGKYRALLAKRGGAREVLVAYFGDETSFKIHAGELP